MASLMEHVVVVTIGAAIVTAVATTDVPEQFHDGVREAVCLVQGPDCGEETWTEHDRPDTPEEAPAAMLAGAELDLSDVENADVAAAIQFALAQQGKPYAWGGNGPNSFDCTGLLYRAYQAAGLDVPRWDTTALYHSDLPSVSWGEMVPGDIILLEMGSTEKYPDHAGMYIGNGQMMHCGNPCQVVNLGTGYQQNFVAARRVIPS